MSLKFETVSILTISSTGKEACPLSVLDIWNYHFKNWAKKGEHKVPVNTSPSETLSDEIKCQGA
ncbi:hypothetical protein PHLCEN_2v5558 [Hermanssonia centrifuga]|uniref:Uncharacterized protein n=1 Tax=Hermanssonia centrifuga TaxID=98765 RepID=A0A2R6P228_9APHY|nr:hypothetical protein PHLCEN_2v5558 [Hermanssonia centrifuga]